LQQGVGALLVAEGEMLLGHLQDGLDKNGIALMSLFEGGQRGLGRAIRAFQQPQMDPGFGVGGVFGEQSVDGGARFVLLAKFAQNADGLDARPCRLGLGRDRLGQQRERAFMLTRAARRLDGGPQPGRERRGRGTGRGEVHGGGVTWGAKIGVEVTRAPVARGPGAARCHMPVMQLSSCRHRCGLEGAARMGLLQLLFALG
jgi:hypothetical protein